MGRRTGFNWLSGVAILWAVITPMSFTAGLLFAAFYDAPLDPQAGMGLRDNLLIVSVFSSPAICLISSFGVWALKNRNSRAATFVALFPIVPLLLIFNFFGGANRSSANPGATIQVSECSPDASTPLDNFMTTGCGTLLPGMLGSGTLSTTQAHNWAFTTEAGQVNITLKNDGHSCPQVRILDSQGTIADGFDENSLRLCAAGMITTGFFEFRPVSPGPYTLRVFSPETPGSYFISAD